MSESKWREALAEVLMRCWVASAAQTPERMAAESADALSPVLAQMKREWQAEALREAADEIEEDAAIVWGGNASWLTTGHHVASLCADVLRDRAEASGQEGER